MEQRSTNWLDWRLQGIGSSDAPVIMGVSPWKTPYQLWEEKTKRVVRDDSNWATQEGNRKEPIARAWYELDTGIEMQPDVGEHAEYPWLRTSFDGINLELKGALEIKCPGKDDHATAVAGKVPDKYYPQVQHQILVGGLDWIDYLSFQDGQNAKVIRVVPDLEYLKKYFVEAEAFWFGCVKADEPPPFSEKDFHKIPAKAKKAVENFLAKKLAAEQADLDLRAARESVLHFLGDTPRAKGYGLTVSTVHRKGSVDYAKVPQLLGVDLEPFRKKGSTVIELRPVKAKEEK